MAPEILTLAPEELPLLAGLPAAAREALLAQAVVHEVAAGTVLFDQGAAPTFQHAVLAGAVHLFGRASDGREVLVEVAGAGELVLPAAVATGSPFLTEGRTLSPARLLLVEARAFRAVLASQPALAQAVIESLSGQFRRMVRQIKNLKLRTAPERVGCYLLALGREQGSATVRLPHEKSLIASELGMTRESFSRALSALQAHGLGARGGVLIIEDAERLAAICHPDPLIDGEPAPRRL